MIHLEQLLLLQIKIVNNNYIAYNDFDLAVLNYYIINLFQIDSGSSPVSPFYAKGNNSN